MIIEKTNSGTCKEHKWFTKVKLRVKFNNSNNEKQTHMTRKEIPIIKDT